MVIHKKKNTDIIWWVKDDNGEQKFSFDRETVFNLMTDYPEKLTPEQKEIFDKENPYWKVYFKKRNISMNDNDQEIKYVQDITPEEYMQLRRDVGWK